ncbi:MAG: type I pullulanase [Prolixibacteraceae bacterium]|nr:type I pullulanase [Prolixibacteraceae bacterium]
MNWTFGHIDFSTYPAYDENTLGAFCDDEKTIFRLWSPTASLVLFRLYNKGHSGDLIDVYHMSKGKNGVWFIELEGNFHGLYYSVQCLIGDRWMDEVPDPYAYAVGVNGRRAMICNFEKINPINWEKDNYILPENYTDMIIYELHVRDFSIDPFSGITNKGKYLSFTESNTRSPESIKTGIDHLKELGITHVHLLPVFDFLTVDESKPDSKQYNWGYDPLNFNAPEGSYSSDPYHGETRILEFKKMVKSLHENGIGVIMDVVYNHTGLINHSYFNQIVPGYYYRQKGNGTFSDASGCGNEIASERTMVRKYIIDSLKFWTKEYHIDGFRFDLMGIFDIETMNSIRSEFDLINPKIILYGEGWTGGESPMNEKLRAVKRNTSQLDRIAVFNDDFRDAVKGHWSDPGSLGFASGQTLNEESVKYGIIAATYHPQIVYNWVASTKWAWSFSPQQSVNYVSCHDNYTLYDKLKLSCPKAGLIDLAKMACLAGAILLTSQGIPFLHSGVEMCRTKRGDHNSYKSGDDINMIDWSRKALFSYVNNYYRDLIKLRKKHPAFRMTNADQIRKYLVFSKYYLPGVVSYEIGPNANNDPWKYIQVIFNNNNHPIPFVIEDRKWKIIAQGYVIDENGISDNHSPKVNVPPVSMLLLACTE